MCLLVPCSVQRDEKYCLRLRAVVCCWQKLSADFKLNSWLWELRVCLDHLENTEALISLAYFKMSLGKISYYLDRSTYPSAVGELSEYGKSFTFQNLNSSKQFLTLVSQVCPCQMILYYYFLGMLHYTLDYEKSAIKSFLLTLH